MSQTEKCITLIWRIKDLNFSFIKTRDIISPCFFAHEMGGIKWYLCLRPNSSGFKSCIACGILAKDTDDAPYEFEFDYEISVFAGVGSVQHSEIFLKKLYKGGYEDWSAALYVKSDEIFLLNKDMCIPEDLLTIRCRMWNRKYSFSLPRIYLALTEFRTTSEILEGKVGNFSSLEPNGKYTIVLPSSYSRETLYLCVNADGKLAIERNHEFLSMHKYEIYIQDTLRNKVKFGQKYIYDSKLHCVPLTISKEYLMKNKIYYLSDDVLSIGCKVTSPTGNIFGDIDPEYGFVYQDQRDLISKESNNSAVFFKKQCIENLITLKDDLVLVFEEGVLCDTKLKTETETFPVHAVVLSARSPVFKSMFTSDMKEKTSNCVNIDDLDADTVRRMLLFMYSANLDDLEYDSAKGLYFAADKYNIVSLFQMCSDFLKQNLLESNCCDTLLLADDHGDNDLKSAVIDYIAINDEVVLLSDEWKNLEMNRPQLTIEALRAVCMKKRMDKDDT